MRSNWIDEASSDLGSRFFVRIREEMGLAYFVGTSQMQGLVPGLFAFYLGTDPEKLGPVRQRSSMRLKTGRLWPNERRIDQGEKS